MSVYSPEDQAATANCVLAVVVGAPFSESEQLGSHARPAKLMSKPVSPVDVAPPGYRTLVGRHPDCRPGRVVAESATNGPRLGRAGGQRRASGAPSQSTMPLRWRPRARAASRSRPAPPWRGGGRPCGDRGPGPAPPWPGPPGSRSTAGSRRGALAPRGHRASRSRPRGGGACGDGRDRAGPCRCERVRRDVDPLQPRVLGPEAGIGVGHLDLAGPQALDLRRRAGRARPRTSRGW